MTKKNKILLFIPIASFVLAMIILAIRFISTKTFSQYESEYLFYKTWWMFLIFIPFCILSLVFGLKDKNRLIVTVSAVLAIVLVVFSFDFFKTLSRFSTSVEALNEIEQRTSIDFPDNTSIVLQDRRVDKSNFGDKDIEYINEGLISFASDVNFSEIIKNDSDWTSSVDLSIKDYIPERFLSRVDWFDKFNYIVNAENEMTFLAYYKEKNIIFFSTVKIVD